VDVGLGHLGLAARADRPGAVALGDRRAPVHGKRAEMGERHGVPVGGRDRHALAGARHDPRERHDSRDGGEDRSSRIARDVNAAVLGRGERMCTVEAERLENGAARRPGPCACRGRRDEGNHDEGKESRRQ
jgi:hypothetical protein